MDAGAREGAGDTGQSQFPHGDRLLEDVRQFAAHPVRAGRDRGAVGGMDLASSGRARLDELYPSDRRVADHPAGYRGSRATACRHHDAQSFRRASGGRSRCAFAVRPARGLSHPPSLADAGCDRPNLVPPFLQSPTSARLDYRGSVQEQASY